MADFFKAFERPNELFIEGDAPAPFPCWCNGAEHFHRCQRRSVTVRRDHLASLDVFRGVTVAGMILVNNPGNWSGTFESLTHADWNGCTFADLVFPFFVFILGAAMPFAFARRISRDDHRSELYLRIARRSAWLIALGLMLNVVAAAPTVVVDACSRRLAADRPRLPHRCTDRHQRASGLAIGRVECAGAGSLGAPDRTDTRLAGRTGAGAQRRRLGRSRGLWQPHAHGNG